MRRTTFVVAATPTFAATSTRTIGRPSWPSLIAIAAGQCVCALLLLVYVFSVPACTAACTPIPTASTTTRLMREESKSTPARCEVELDIFSGMPNPTWSLTDAQAERFVKRVAALPRAAAGTLSNPLGYRGFIVQCTRGADTQLIRIQNGTVHISNAERNLYSSDTGRELERWLLNTGRPHLKNELLQIVEREFR